MTHLKNRLSETVSDPALSTRIYTTIRNGTTHNINITSAWNGRTAFRIEESGQSRVEWGDKDFLIPVEILLIDDERIEPQKGDRITETYTEPSGTKVYEIMAPFDEQPWRYSDANHTLFRVHTKEQST